MPVMQKLVKAHGGDDAMTDAGTRRCAVIELGCDDGRILLTSTIKRQHYGRHRAGRTWRTRRRCCRPSTSFAADFGVSRMTVNRAMRELAAEHLVRRVPGLGTFVAEPVAESSAGRNSQYCGRGRRAVATSHHARGAHTLERTALADAAALGFSTFPQAERCSIPRSCISKTACPFNIEDKLVDPASAPDYLSQDFSRKLPPTNICRRVAPLREVEHVVQAVHAPAEIAQFNSAMPTNDAPCLLVVRRTWSGMNRLVDAQPSLPPGQQFVPVELAASGRAMEELGRESLPPQTPRHQFEPRFKFRRAVSAGWHIPPSSFLGSTHE